MKHIIVLALVLLPIILTGITRYVSLDGTQQYSSIQTAINESVSGDIVLVYPGRYIENLNLSNKSGIILASLEYTTSDTTYISSTIIDGSSYNNSTILCYENTVNCTIRGFSITGGSGYDYFNGTSPYQIFGGGIFVYQNCSLNLMNLNIYSNKSSVGGGISLLQACTVTMSNVNLYNNIARYRGGGLSIGGGIDNFPVITFDQVNRCSIYNNFAQWGLDVDWNFINGGSVSVYLKRFTAPQWEKYFADYYDSEYPPSPYSVFDVQESYLQPVDADLYVSPTGNDSNSGLSPTSALKTPSRAMQRIASNPNNPRTVYLLAGEHHNIFGGEYLPIAIKDYTILQGVSQTQTRLYGENMIEGTGVVTMGIERYGMTLRDLSITTSNASAIFSWGIHNCLVENVTIENSTVDRWLFTTGYITSTFTLSNITMRNNTANFHDYGLRLEGSVIVIDNVLMQDNQVPSLPTYWYQRGCGGFDIYVKDSLTIKNSKFVNNTHFSEDGFSNFRVNTLSDMWNSVVTFDNCLFASNFAYGGVRDIRFVNIDVLNLINCTFANNTNNYTDYLYISSESTSIVNCLFSNNNSYYEIRSNNNTLVENSLFSRSNNIWRTYNGEPLIWGQNNLVGTNPLFSGTDPTLPSYYYLFADDEHGYSPAIDAGTTDPFILPDGYQIPGYDAFGFNRIYGNNIDIGCFESPGYTYNCDPVVVPSDKLELNNYPNPFNESTKIKYTLPMDGEVKLYIYNVRGQFIKKLVSNSQSKGEYQVNWNGDDQNGKKVSAGIYFCRLEILGKAITGKMLLLK
ncbi:MAG TPA: FlgD immunoglobulin-like domain containing protein [Candidatus Cloacimonadota bacterium]|nr:FlgD immunoglobulin-like domain containing protein [Candidatus Cloacimonadota bacterium]